MITRGKWLPLYCRGPGLPLVTVQLFTSTAGPIIFSTTIWLDGSMIAALTSTPLNCVNMGVYCFLIRNPNYCRNLEEYFPEMDAAIQRITKRDSHHYLMVCGHSTGGLTASLYAQSGAYKQSIKKLILNSPFLGFKADALTMNLLRFYGFLGGFNYNAVLPRAGSPLYTQTIHASEKGSWDFNFAWRPRTGFPFYQSWVHAILNGQTQINQGSGIQCPVLVLTSYQSYSGEKLNAAAMSSDVVLDVPTIQKQAIKLGKQITRVAIPGALHDVFLSPPNARKQAFIAMEKWLNREQ